jgi:hypothetical protein
VEDTWDLKDRITPGATPIRYKVDSHEMFFDEIGF